MQQLFRNKTVFAGLVTVLITGCGQSGTSYSMLSTAQTFKQTVNSQIDLLWVIDNSPSMLPLQQNMTTNFNSFMTNFISKGYDFHLAVTTTDAYLSLPQFQNDSTLSKFRDGLDNIHTGIFDILPATLNLEATFVTNASQGANGSYDENAFSSFKAALNNPANAGFLRSKSFFAMIILSDEDDFSDPNRPEGSWTVQGGIADHDYNNPGLETVDSYLAYLDTLTATTGATRRYSVSAMTVLDSACQAAHVGASATTIIGQRYIDMASKTNGITGSICDQSYANSLADIQNQIIELGTQFYLANTPVVSTISVLINDVSIPQDSVNGWTYSSGANSIVFHGAAIPAAGSNIAVNFEPASLTF